MPQDNPYASPSAGSSDAIDPRLLRLVAAHLAKARQHPPTAIRSLLRWPGTLRTLTIGAVGTAILTFLSARPDAVITSHWPLGLAALIAGAALRDVGYAQRASQLWKPQAYFIDWRKVDEFTA